MSPLDVTSKVSVDLARPRDDGPEVEWRRSAGGRRLPSGAVLTGAVAAAISVGSVLRLLAPPALWLDEAQAVAIARLPPGAMFEALRADGAPPLWYLLLHGWIRVFGDVTAAVRLLPILFGLATLPVAWRVGRLVGRRRTAATLTVLVATSPFAIRYASETRMYSLQLLLVFVGAMLVLDGLRRRVGTKHLAGVAVTSGALLLTHYWSFFLLAATAVALVVAGRRPADRRRAWPLAGAIASGGLLFVPWLPSFLRQLEETGAPWGRPPGAAIVEMAVRGFGGGGGGGPAGSLLGILLLLAAGAAVAMPFLAGDRRRARLPAVLVAVSIGTLLLGGASLALSGDGFAPRHATVALPPLLLAVALVADDLRARPAVAAVAVMATLGLMVAVPDSRADRTQAPQIAAVLAASVRRGDVVATCPDQLAPALTRLVPDRARPTSLLPSGSTAERIDWTDYAARVRAADPTRFAAALDAAAGPGTVWFASSPNYVGVGRKCTAAERALRKLRPGTERVVALRRGVFENAALWRAPPVAPAPAAAPPTPSGAVPRQAP